LRSSTGWPATTPTLTAATQSRIAADGWSAGTRAIASATARKPPVIAAVRVPPSAWSTSQSTQSVRSPSAFVSTTERRLRPIRRWISSVRPDDLPREISRSVRRSVEPGSSEYSAVTQPRPCPCRKRGTLSSRQTVHSTLVRPNEISALPSA
jgi:hypothetical protein